MKNANIKRIFLTLGIAFVFAIAFFCVQYVVREVSLQISLIGAIILFVLISILPIFFLLADKIKERRAKNSK